MKTLVFTIALTLSFSGKASEEQKDATVIKGTDPCLKWAILEKTIEALALHARPPRHLEDRPLWLRLPKIAAAKKEFEEDLGLSPEGAALVENLRRVFQKIPDEIWIGRELTILRRDGTAKPGFGYVLDLQSLKLLDTIHRQVLEGADRSSPASDAAVEAILFLQKVYRTYLNRRKLSSEKLALLHKHDGDLLFRSQFVMLSGNSLDQTLRSSEQIEGGLRWISSKGPEEPLSIEIEHDLKLARPNNGPIVEIGRYVNDRELSKESRLELLKLTYYSIRRSYPGQNVTIYISTDEAGAGIYNKGLGFKEIPGTANDRILVTTLDELGSRLGFESH